MVNFQLFPKRHETADNKHLVLAAAARYLILFKYEYEYHTTAASHVRQQSVCLGDIRVRE